MHGLILKAAAVLGLSASAAIQPPQPQPQVQPRPGSPATSKPAADAPAKAAPLTPLAHVEVRGKGPVPMILIAGLTCDWTVFDAFMTRNADRYTMYAVRLPGFGGSQPPAVPEGSTYRDGAWMDNAERAVAALIRERKLDRPIVAGHSLGGHLALRVGLHEPELVRGVIDIDGFPSFPAGPGVGTLTQEDRIEAFERGMAPRLPADDEAERTYMKNFAKFAVSDPHRVEELATMMSAVPRETMRRYMAEMFITDLGPELGQMKPRTLIIAAVAPANDMVRAAAKASWAKLAEPATTATVVYFEDTRHFVMDDAPAELDAAVAAFVAEKPVPGKAAKKKAEESEEAPKTEKPAEAKP